MPTLSTRKIFDWCLLCHLLPEPRERRDGVHTCVCAYVCVSQWGVGSERNEVPLLMWLTHRTPFLPLPLVDHVVEVPGG